MKPTAACMNRSSRSSSCERLVAISLTLLAVFSPLYINRRPTSDLELEDQTINLDSWLPLLLLLLILAIALSLYLDQSFSRFDPYWIHRVGGSSGGIIIILLCTVLCVFFNKIVTYLKKPFLNQSAGSMFIQHPTLSPQSSHQASANLRIFHPSYLIMHHASMGYHERVGTWGGRFQTEMIKNLSDLNFINQLIKKSMGSSAMDPSAVQGHPDVLIMVLIPIQ
ncbi:hypothetical protein Patl1_13768 [Pistacia atlantica]|uniref:Uncharacterized protein n=1 Tax=Pistacia atlantica TaxID=434234 RepID=A0ACC1AVR5_9ROSI|nr:hypothetical protein Patl1_13768 [Pistacia atlantica]